MLMMILSYDIDDGALFSIQSDCCNVLITLTNHGYQKEMKDGHF